MQDEDIDPDGHEHGDHDHLRALTLVSADDVSITSGVFGNFVSEDLGFEQRGFGEGIMDAFSYDPENNVVDIEAVASGETVNGWFYELALDPGTYLIAARSDVEPTEPLLLLAEGRAAVVEVNDNLTRCIHVDSFGEPLRLLCGADVGPTYP